RRRRLGWTRKWPRPTPTSSGSTPSSPTRNSSPMRRRRSSRRKRKNARRRWRARPKSSRRSSGSGTRPERGGDMRGGQPSHTARGAAAYRALHQMLDGGVIFRDPLASKLLDDETRPRLDDIAADDSLRPWRLFIAARSRFSEDALAASVAGGVRQVVILGAGLDTFSLRNPHGDQGVRVFEVDHPATQEWKRGRLQRAGLAVPASLTFVPIDFERESLADGLKAAGFRADHPAFFQWLGVVPYLTHEAVSATLEFIAGVAGSEVVFDYAEPLENYRADRRAQVTAVAARAA